MEAISFKGTLEHILRKVLAADPHLRPIYIIKVDLVETYMRLWVNMEGDLSIAFLIMKKRQSDPQLVGFHLSLPTGYVDSAPYFCMATKMVTYFSNAALDHCTEAQVHPLEAALEVWAEDYAGTLESQAYDIWEQLTNMQRSAVAANANVYLDGFIPLIHGGPTKRS